MTDSEATVLARDGWLLLGHCFARLSRTSEAKKRSFEHALKLDPLDPRPYDGLLWSQITSGDAYTRIWKEAQQEFRVETWITAPVATGRGQFFDPDFAAILRQAALDVIAIITAKQQ